MKYGSSEQDYARIYKLLRFYKLVSADGSPYPASAALASHDAYGDLQKRRATLRAILQL